MVNSDQRTDQDKSKTTQMVVSRTQWEASIVGKKQVENEIDTFTDKT